MIAGLAASLIAGFGLGRLPLGKDAPGRIDTERAGVTPTAEDALYTQTTSGYLLRTAALLLSLPASSQRAAGLDTLTVSRATDLLSTTRLLIDSPAARDPELRALMSDLELVLAQIVQLRFESNRGELDLINHALEQRELLPRIHSAVTTANN
jgi:hypothetical protein